MDITDRRSRQRLAALLAWCLVLLLSWGLMLWELDASDLTHDEVISFHWANRPLPQMLGQLQEAVREHPPTYYLLLDAWMTATGSSEYSLRLFTAATAMLSLVLVGWVARLSLRSFGGMASIVPVVLLAITPGMVYYARVARMYQMVVALPLLSTGLFLRGFLRRRTWPHWASVAGLALVHLGAITTHYYLVLPMIVQLLVLLLRRRWKPLAAWCGAQSVPILVVLAWFLISPGLQNTTGSFSLQRVIPTGFEFLHLAGKLLFSPVVRVQYWPVIVLLVLVGAGVVIALRRDRAVGAWLLLTLVVPIAVAYAIPNAPEPRLILFTLPSVALALGAVCVTPVSLARVLSRGAAVGLTSFLTIGAGWLLARGGLVQAVSFDRSDYGHTLDTIAALSRPGDVVLFYGPWQEIMLDYYDPGGLPPIVAVPKQAPPRLRPTEAEPVLRHLVESYRRIWVLPAAVSDVDPRFYAGGWLLNNAHNVWETGDFGLYLPLLPVDADSSEPALVFGGALRLESLHYERMPVPAGEPVRLTLRWSVLRALEQHVQMTLTLVDDAERVWAVARPTPGYWADSADTWIPGRTTNVLTGLVVPQGAPPGNYTLRLMVSEAGTGAPLQVGEVNTAPLLAVQVTEPVAKTVLWDLPGTQQTRFCSLDGGACVDVVGVEPGGTRFQQGHPVSYAIHWVAEGPPLPGVVPQLSVVHDPRAPWARESLVLSATLSSPWSYAAESSTRGEDVVSSPGGSAVEMPVLSHRVMLPLVLSGSEYTPLVHGRLVTAPGAFVLSPDAKEGRARVELSVLGPDGQEWQTPEGETVTRLFDIDVEKRPTLRELPAGLDPVDVDFGEAVAMRGYRVQGDARPGGRLRITYAWYAKERPTQIFSVFNHVTGPDGTIIAQADGWPLNGRVLTTQWQPKEYLRDTYTIDIPTDAPAGPYRLYVGLYDAATGDRPAVVAAGEVQADGRLQIPLPGDPPQ
jgi:hypothetical protein